MTAAAAAVLVSLCALPSRADMTARHDPRVTQSREQLRNEARAFQDYFHYATFDELIQAEGAPQGKVLNLDASRAQYAQDMGVIDATIRVTQRSMFAADLDRYRQQFTEARDRIIRLRQSVMVASGRASESGAWQMEVANAYIVGQLAQSRVDPALKASIESDVQNFAREDQLRWDAERLGVKTQVDAILNGGAPRRSNTLAAGVLKAKSNDSAGDFRVRPPQSPSQAAPPPQPVLTPISVADRGAIAQMMDALHFWRPTSRDPKHRVAAFAQIQPRFVDKLAGDHIGRVTAGLAQVKAESGGNWWAISSKNAQGLRQILPSTRDRFLLPVMQRNRCAPDPAMGLRPLPLSFDPCASWEGGQSYFEDSLLRHYQSSIRDSDRRQQDARQVLTMLYDRLTSVLDQAYTVYVRTPASTAFRRAYDYAFLNIPHYFHAAYVDYISGDDARARRFERRGVDLDNVAPEALITRDKRGEIPRYVRDIVANMVKVTIARHSVFESVREQVPIYRAEARPGPLSNGTEQFGP